jgi:hypothetical protein
MLFKTRRLKAVKLSEARLRQNVSDQQNSTSPVIADGCLISWMIRLKLDGLKPSSYKRHLYASDVASCVVPEGSGGDFAALVYLLIGASVYASYSTEDQGSLHPNSWSFARPRSCQLP